MTIKEIIKQYLKKNGYTGLYNDYYDCAGCEIDDLFPFPCYTPRLECRPGYINYCNECNLRTTGECIKDDIGFCVKGEKEKGRKT